MTDSLYDKVNQALQNAATHNSSITVKPEVILWPDPEKQWETIIPILQEEIPYLLIFGEYKPEIKQGPSIWLKCMVAKSLPEANWDSFATPIIYMPGIAKTNLRNVESASISFQPLIEYQYTGTLFLQENGREWTILAFLENPIHGLGQKVAKDSATKEALRKTLPAIFQDKTALSGHNIIDANLLNNYIFPNIIPTILKWMCKGDAVFKSMDEPSKEAFTSLCKSHSIAEKLGKQQGPWKNIWQFYASAPAKYPEMEQFLQLAKPKDMGSGIFELPIESWPQINSEQEAILAKELITAATQDQSKALITLRNAEQNHALRRTWVWFELGKSPLAASLLHLLPMAEASLSPIPYSSIDSITAYYCNDGFLVDQYMRMALAAVKTQKDKSLIKDIINLFYKPWIESLTTKFQTLIENNESIFKNTAPNTDSEQFILFVDAFRYELAHDFGDYLSKIGIDSTLKHTWSSIPSLTATAKPAVAPIASQVSLSSVINEFRPQLKNGKDLLTPAFREALKTAGYTHITNTEQIDPNIKCWQEIGNIDTHGHEEQADLVKRIGELFDQLIDVISVAFEKGVKQIKIVTDHGWLLLPGGLPKTQLNAGLAETRWGRCALIKEGVQTDLLHLPWSWNQNIYIAYAPGISFFKANVEYAHGGISLHECLVPEMHIQSPVEMAIPSKIIGVKWVNLKCTVTTENAPEGYSLSIRTKFNDPSSSILEPINLSDKPIKDNRCVIMVSEEAESQAAVVVLLDDNGRIIDKKITTVAE